MKVHTIAKVVASLFAILLILPGTRGDEDNSCGPNAEYKSCGTACPTTCENRNKSFACIAVCVPGCFCRNNYVRSADGACIPINDCPAA